MGAIRLRIILLQSTGDTGQFLLRLSQRDAWFQEHEALEGTGTAIFQLVAGRIESFLHRQRHPELKRSSDEGAGECFRRDADDGVLDAIQILRLADDLRVALVTILPHLIADYCDRMGVAPHALFRPEATAQDWAHAERIKVVRRNETSECALGVIADAERRRNELVDDERLDQGAVFFEIDAIGMRELIKARRTARRSRQDKHSFLVRHRWVGMKEDSFDPTKNGRIRPDAESQAKNGEKGESRVAPQHANAEAQVLPELIWPTSRPVARAPAPYIVRRLQIPGVRRCVLLPETCRPRPCVRSRNPGGAGFPPPFPRRAVSFRIGRKDASTPRGLFS